MVGIMRKIVVAGAGIGGLSAAYLLSKNGFSVLVYEKLPESSMGYDWADCIERSIFDKLDVSYPDIDKLPVLKKMCYYSPSKRVRLVEHERDKSSVICIERKDLARFMIDICREAGTEFRFETDILGAVTENDTVTGIRVASGETEETVYGDLVIDACGMDSPVKSTLPGSAGIDGKILPEDTFFVYRGYHRRAQDTEYDPPYRMYFFHNGLKGLDWVISEEGYYDILIGAFGGITESDIESNIHDFMKDYPDMEENPFRGGSVGKIPVRCALPVFVCNGYAAAGNSASMVEPLSGSGISLGIKAGKILAETIIENSDSVFDTGVLWKYNRRYHEELGFRQFNSDNIRRMLCRLNGEELDYLLDNDVITKAEVIGPKARYSASDILRKAAVVVRRKNIVRVLLGFAKRNAVYGKIRKQLPETYQAEAVRAWVHTYEKFYN